MYQLVLHHTYIGGSTFDVSGKGNHGAPTDVVQGAGAEAGSYEFYTQTSGIMVKPAPSLSNLTALRVRMKVRAEPWDGQRRNLMEGFISFAFVLTGDGHLSGSIVDATGSWNSVTSPTPLAPNKWHEVEMLHNGLGTLALKLNGTVVAARHDIPGPVRSVGDLGVAIGRWPDRNRYVYKGHIGELQLWRFDPVRSATQYWDCCCYQELGPIEGVLAALRNRGLDWKSMAYLARRAEGTARQLLWDTGSVDEDAASEVSRLLRQLRSALLTHDRRRVAALSDRLRSLVDTNAGPQARDRWSHEITQILEELGLIRADIITLLRALCLDGVLPPDDGDRQASATHFPIEDDPWNRIVVPETLAPPKSEEG